MIVIAKSALTPALSHPMGEGESFVGFVESRAAGFAGRPFAKPKIADCCSLSRRTGEGQGEGIA